MDKLKIEQAKDIMVKVKELVEEKYEFDCGGVSCEDCPFTMVKHVNNLDMCDIFSKMKIMLGGEI